ncbi:MAG: fumarate hydratase [Firmicutes bacterium]|nr:fumarate hydratase [Bacillota bacterium]
MRELTADLIEARVAELCQEASFELPCDVEAALAAALEQEESPLGRMILKDLLENAALARQERIPLCQDTGLVVVFVEIGQEVRVTGGSLGDAINRGVARGYREGCLRKSVVADPLRRVNTGDNTPAVIHYEIVPGAAFRLSVMPKGFGSENCTALGMLRPTAGREGVKEFVTAAVRQAGANPCPPVVVGVGLGGTAEKALFLARRALLRPLGAFHPDPEVATLEAELKEAVNALGLGPGGLGGTVTALAVHIETYPTHIAGLPVGVSISCHAARHRTWVWGGEEDE